MKNMSSLLLKTAIFTIIFSSPIFAQDNYVSGNVTKNDGAILTGQINYQDWKKTPNTIEFKSGDVVEIFKPSDLKAFEVENDKFIVKDITLDITEQKLQVLTKRHEPKFKDLRVFLNVLELGEVSLYEYYDSRPHYFAEKGDDFMELTSRILIDEKTGDIKHNRSYLGQLTVFLKECSSVSINENLGYKRKELLKLIAKYNNCVSVSGSKEEYTKDISGSKNSLFVTGGLSFSTLNIDSPQTSIKDFEGSQAIAPNLGIAYDFSFAKNRQKWSLYTELLYSSFKSDETTEERTEFRSYTPLKMEFKTLDFSLLFRHKFSKENQKVTPFLNLGLGRSIVINQNNTVTENDFFDASRTKEIPVEINSGYFNFLLGGGVFYKKMSAEIRYSMGDKLTNILSESIKLSSLRLLISYKLN